MRTIAAIAVTAVLTILSGCGGSDDEPETTTVSVTLPSESSSTVTTNPDQTITDPDTVATGGTETPQPGSGEGASSAIEAAEAVLTAAGSPEQACGSFVTENFIVTSYGGEANCIAARKGQPLASAISVQTGDETSTHLVVVPKGGPYADARVEVELVDEEDGFRVESLDAHVPAGP